MSITPNQNFKILFRPDIRCLPKFQQIGLDYIRQGPYFCPKFVQMAIKPPDLYLGVLDKVDSGYNIYLVIIICHCCYTELLQT
jgi:hypothetical protein